MGVPKHAAQSARTRSCKKYKDEDRYFFNKGYREKRLAEGKKIRHKHFPETQDMRNEKMIRNLDFIMAAEEEKRRSEEKKEPHKRQPVIEEDDIYATPY